MSSTVSSIGNHVFDSCKSLEHIVFPDSTVSVGENAFEECEKLKGVYFPSDVCSLNLVAGTIPENTIIYGQKDSPVEEYAVQFKRKFVDINSVETIYHGDCNMDGKLSVADAVVLEKWLLSEEKTDVSDWKAADLCKDGKLDVFDFVVLRKKVINS